VLPLSAAGARVDPVGVGLGSWLLAVFVGSESSELSVLDIGFGVIIVVDVGWPPNPCMINFPSSTELRLTLDAGDPVDKTVPDTAPAVPVTPDVAAVGADTASGVGVPSTTSAVVEAVRSMDKDMI